jgi:hypothetical protein
MHRTGNPFHEVASFVGSNDPQPLAPLLSYGSGSGSGGGGGGGGGGVIEDDDDEYDEFGLGGSDSGSGYSSSNSSNSSAANVQEEQQVFGSEERLFGSRHAVTSGALNGFTRSVGRYTQVMALLPAVAEEAHAG